MNTIPKEYDMVFTVTVTYDVPAYGDSKMDCLGMIENMTLEDIHRDGIMQEIDIGDGEVI